MCDRDPERLSALGRSHPDAAALQDFDAVLCDDAVEAVIVATPPKTHHPLAMRALEAGKHVLVEKPLATTLDDGRELAELARSSGLTLMPGHTFIYSPAVNTVRDLIQTDVVGDIHFVTSSRMNLGKYQGDGVVCDLAPHDLSILLYWLERAGGRDRRVGKLRVREDVPETAFLTLTFAGGATANVQLSWLAPRKVRQMIVVGSKRMVQYDDTASDEPVRVYDRGMDVGPPSNFGEHQLVYRSGDVVIPRVAAAGAAAPRAAGLRPRDPHRRGTPLEHRARPGHRRGRGDGGGLDARQRRTAGVCPVRRAGRRVEHLLTSARIARRVRE